MFGSLETFLDCSELVSAYLLRFKAKDCLRVSEIYSEELLELFLVLSE